MPPVPSRTHQDLQGQLEMWLRSHWAQPRGNKVYHEINLASVGGWPNDYRIPDLVLLTPDRFGIDHDEYFEGPPTVVVEIRSPGDESIEKLPFYAALGVPEVWVIDRDTRLPEIHVLTSGGYAELPPLADGWLHSAVTGIQVRGQSGRKMAIQIVGDRATQRLLPED